MKYLIVINLFFMTVATSCQRKMGPREIFIETNWYKLEILDHCLTDERWPNSRGQISSSQCTTLSAIVSMALNGDYDNEVIYQPEYNTPSNFKNFECAYKFQFEEWFLDSINNVRDFAQPYPFDSISNHQIINGLKKSFGFQIKKKSKTYTAYRAVVKDSSRLHKYLSPLPKNKGGSASAGSGGRPGAYRHFDLSLQSYSLSYLGRGIHSFIKKPIIWPVNEQNYTLHFEILMTDTGNWNELKEQLKEQFNIELVEEKIRLPYAEIKLL